MPRQTREEAVSFAQKLCALQTKDLQFQVAQGVQELDRRNCASVGKVTRAEGTE
jgi:hypothetical protein